MIALNCCHPIWAKIQNKILWAPLRMLESDHRRLLAQIQKLKKIFQKWRRQAPGAWATRDKKHVQTWFREHQLHLGSHFEAEENTVFPYLARQMPHLKPALSKLMHEHRDIRRESLAVETTFHTLCKPTLHSQKDGSFCRKALAMLLLIERHVTQEQRLMKSTS